MSINQANLQPFTLDEESQEKAREFGSKGGKASGEAKRAKKTLKSVAQALLDMPAVLTEEMKNKLRPLFPNIDNEEVTARTLGLFALYGRVMKGDPKAFEVLRDTAGEKPVDKRAFTDPEGNELDKEIVVKFVDTDSK